MKPFTQKNSLPLGVWRSHTQDVLAILMRCKTPAPDTYPYGLVFVEGPFRGLVAFGISDLALRESGDLFCGGKFCVSVVGGPARQNPKSVYKDRAKRKLRVNRAPHAFHAPTNYDWRG